MVTADPSLAAAVQQFLFREARLLDERRWDDWLALWAPDGRYLVPTRETRRNELDDPFALSSEVAPAGDLWWFDDTRDLLALRVEKLRTRKTWVEEPPSRTRRLITNVEVRLRPSDGGAGGPTEVEARSNFLLYRNRREADVELIAGCRCDQLSTAGPGGGWVLHQRTVVLDATVLPTSDLAVFL